MDELPVLAALQEEFAHSGVSVITVCLGASREEVQGVLEEESVHLLTLVDEDMESAATYHAMSTPTNYLIDADGIVVFSDVGYGSGTYDILRGQILQLLEDSGE